MNYFPKSLRIILLCLVAYSGLFIFRSSFVIESTRYFCLFDDAMISMQYAQNLVHGNGLTWNAHEKIEGISNPAWTMMMALIHIFPIPQHLTSLMVQIIGCILLVAQCIIIWKLCERLFPQSTITAIIATLCTGLYLPFLTWSLMGMEVSLCAFILTYCISKIDGYAETTSIPWKEIVLLAFGTSIRIDMVVPAIVLISSLALRKKSIHIPTLLSGFIACAVVIALQTLLRYEYYGALLPNTYYLKMTGIDPLYRISRGVFSAVKFMVFFNPLLIILPFIYIRKHGNHMLYTIGALFIAQISYSIYVGGDAWDWWGGANRYISLAICPFFIILSASLSHYFDKIKDRFTFLHRRKTLFLPVGIILLLCQINYQRDGSSLATWLLIEQPFGTADNKANVEIALLLQETHQQAKIATVTAGAIHYFAQRTMIDILGKNDIYIAHLPCNIPQNRNKYISFHPGHNKFDFHYSLQTKNPDIVIGVSKDDSLVQRYISEFQQDTYKGHILYSRKNSDLLENYRKKIVTSQQERIHNEYH